MASLELETAVIESSGISAIAGVDETGRGALAGPVVAAAVILPLSSPDCLQQLSEVNDSKQLSAKNRDRLYEIIIELALSFGIGACTADYIDRHGIITATKQAMLEALKPLKPPAKHLLIDGRIRLGHLPIPQQSIIRGDSLSLSIAAASIVAKVTRDRTMIAMEDQYPHYGFARHKGYGTQYHREALERLGPTPEHRRSFAPLRSTLL